MKTAPDRENDDARLACAAALVLFAGGAFAWLRDGAQDARAPALELHRVDLNASSAGEIEALPGVGPVLAARIVVARAEAPFTSADELHRVPGIGPVTLARMRPFVRCEGR
jgi:predicted DNA-binding helix-hairpin-helix protein